MRRRLINLIRGKFAVGDTFVFNDVLKLTSGDALFKSIDISSLLIELANAGTQIGWVGESKSRKYTLLAVTSVEQLAVDEPEEGEGMSNDLFGLMLVVLHELLMAAPGRAQRRRVPLPEFVAVLREQQVCTAANAVHNVTGLEEAGYVVSVTVGNVREFSITASGYELIGEAAPVEESTPVVEEVVPVQETVVMNKWYGVYMDEGQRLLEAMRTIRKDWSIIYSAVSKIGNALYICLLKDGYLVSGPNGITVNLQRFRETYFCVVDADTSFSRWNKRSQDLEASDVETVNVDQWLVDLGNQLRAKAVPSPKPEEPKPEEPKPVDPLEIRAEKEIAIREQHIDQLVAAMARDQAQVDAFKRQIEALQSIRAYQVEHEKERARLAQIEEDMRALARDIVPIPTI